MIPLGLNSLASSCPRPDVMVRDIKPLPDEAVDVRDPLEERLPEGLGGGQYLRKYISYIT